MTIEYPKDLKERERNFKYQQEFLNQKYHFKTKWFELSIRETVGY